MNEAHLREAARAYARALDEDSETRAARTTLRERAARAAEKLSPGRLEALDDEALRELLFDTESFERRRHRAWSFRRLAESSGLAAVRDALRELLARAPLGLTAADLRALTNKRGLGPLLSTELLAYKHPARYWIYSPRDTLSSLALLGEDVRGSLPAGGRSDAGLYFALAPRMLRVRDALGAAGVEPADNLDAAAFLAWLPRAPTHSRASAPAPTARPRRLRETPREAPPQPPPTSRPPAPATPAPAMQHPRATLVDGMRARGLHFDPWELGVFYTALSLKGFVVLTGISGTGKTRLAQRFAELLPQPPPAPPALPSGSLVTQLTGAALASGRVPLPLGVLRMFDLPLGDEARDLTVHFGDAHEPCSFVRVSYAGRELLALALRSEARRWLAEGAREGDALVLEPRVDQEERLAGFAASLRPAWPPERVSGEPAPRCWLFLPVRPDARDGRSMLGYFNPLARTYEWTPLLRFLVRAAESHRRGARLAWFVLLDEMNLAPVEHYFAELLSVLESGRDAQGFTREALSFTYPDDAEGELPPKALHLPPNVYFVGTVNVDETTQPFSPKVLDRAFTLELAGVDLRSYRPVEAEARDPGPDAREALLRSFTRGGRFAGVEKPDVAAQLDRTPSLRDRLARLNEALRPFELHFGFRVFDECVAFCAEALHNGIFAPDAGVTPHDAALDAALCTKILPRLHGPRARVEEALRAVLAFCDDPDRDALPDALEAGESEDEAAAPPAKLPRAAARARRLLHAARASGYAPFG